MLAIVVAWLALANVGCEADAPSSELVPMPTGNAELRRELLAELDKKDIWHNVVDDSSIEIEFEDTTQVGEIFDGIIRNVLPRDRSISPAPHLMDELTESLRSQDIVCKSVHAFGKEWLVCTSEDMALVNETLTNIVTNNEGAPLD